MLSPTKERITQHLEILVGERNPYTSPGHLAASGDYISQQFKHIGLKIREDRVPFDSMETKNILGIQPGPNKGIFIVGAHYDSVQGTPGADDNASAVAALLEIARCLQPFPLKYSLIFCGFTLEEYGFVGSRQFAKSLRSQKDEVLGMISLEMLGFCNREKGSQTYPLYVDPTQYPDRGDFIAVVGNEPSVGLTLALVNGMKESVPQLPVEHLVVPGRGDQFEDVRLSDHAPFWDDGFQAVMVTDTAFFRNPHYHQFTDTLETLDLEFLKNVAGSVAGFLKLYLS